MRKFVRFVMDQKASSESPESSNVSSAGYEIKDKDLGKVHRAACAGDLAKLKKLAEKNDLNQVDKEDRTPLHLACAKGHAQIVRFLVESEAELNRYDRQKHSPLMKAVQCQQERCASTLLEHNADPDLADTDGNTALHLAAAAAAASPSALPLAKLLLEHKARIDAQNSNGRTPLIVAVMAKHFEMAQLLLEEGADVNAKDHEQRTPLMIAAHQGLANLVSLLLLHDADVTAKDKRGKTPDDHAVCNGYFICSRLIMKHGRSRQFQLLPSCLAPNKNKHMSSGLVKGSETDLSLGTPPAIREVNSRINCGSGDSWLSSDVKWLDFIPKKVQNSTLVDLMKASEKKSINAGITERPQAKPQLSCPARHAPDEDEDLSDWDSSSIESMDISGYAKVLRPEADARNDAQRLLRQEPGEGERGAKAADRHASVHNLSAQLSAAKTRVDSLESEFHRTMLSLTEKNRLLETVQRELRGTQARLAELQAALRVKREQKATPHQMTQTERKPGWTVEVEMQSQLLWQEYEKMEKERVTSAQGSDAAAFSPGDSTGTVYRRGPHLDTCISLQRDVRNEAPREQARSVVGLSATFSFLLDAAFLHLRL